MSDIVTLAEQKAFLTVSGDAPPLADDAILQAIINEVEALFESATLRTPGSYTAAASGRTEILDGTGSSRLYLTYPISALTSVKLGYDPAAPTETLAVANKLVVVYGVGSRAITRSDGGQFGLVRQARYVQVVYDHLGNLPEAAKLPIMEVVASVYRNRGSEGMKSETVGSFYTYTRDDAQAAASTNVNWQLAVEANTPVVLA